MIISTQKSVRIILFTFCGFPFIACRSENRYNLNFENVDNNHNPVNWQPKMGHQKNGYVFKLYSDKVKTGRYSLGISGDNPYDTTTTAFCKLELPAPRLARFLTLTGYIKAEKVSQAAGLWVEVEDDAGKITSLNKMERNFLKGNVNWKACTVSVSLNTSFPEKIKFGGYLTGPGKIWLDELKLQVDGKSIDSYLLPVVRKANLDTSFSMMSGIHLNNLNPLKIRRLTNLGMIWGFLKYHHPKIAKGDVAWDAQLLSFLPKSINIKSDQEFYKRVELWVDKLGPVQIKNKSNIDLTKIKRQPKYGDIFQNNNMPGSLIAKLENIRNNYIPPRDHYYLRFEEQQGNPVFLRERRYDSSDYPDDGIRLLGLFRYWSQIRYFYPYNYLTLKDWNKVLPEYIPKFIDAQNASEYLLVCLSLIESLGDTHANIWNNKILDSLKGKYILPIKAEFIEDKLVVTGFHEGFDHEGFKSGDIIDKIDGNLVSELVLKYINLTPGSNLEVKLRDLTSVNGFLLRGNLSNAKLTINRGGSLTMFVRRVEVNKVKISGHTRVTKIGYKLLTKNIGYIDASAIKDNDIFAIKKIFKNTDGIVIDLRGYPSTFMPYIYSAWLKPNITEFSTITRMSLAKPGAIFYDKTLSCGPSITTSKDELYKGRIILLVNSQTQSQGEFTTMALSTAPAALTIGSQTAGADGDVSYIILPGGIYTTISGLGVYYPNYTSTQKKGVKIDIITRKTISGVKREADELLERAINLIN